jgi:hypothetical protein
MLLLLAGAGLAACDIMPGLNSGQGSSDPAPDSLQISLLASGQMVTGMSDPGPLRVRTVGPGKKSGGNVSFDAKHACTITLYRSDGPRGAGYYHRSAELSYPDSVLARADGKTKPLRGRIRAPAVPHPSNVSVRLRCRLPDVKGAEKRVRSFFRFSSEQLRGGGFKTTDGISTSGKTTANDLAKQCETTTATVCVGSFCGVKDTFEQCSGGSGGGGLAVWQGALAQDGYNVRTIDGPDVNGGPSNDPDPEPDVEENRLCSKDPLKDMDIRATCAGIEGGRYGEDECTG